MELFAVIFSVLVGIVLLWTYKTAKEPESDRLTTLELELEANWKIESALARACEKHELSVDQLNLIYERKELLKEDGASAPLFFKKLKIFRHRDNSYWLGIFYSNSEEALLQKIPELRARRALFLHPREYQTAFGAYPHRDQLKPLFDNAVKTELDGFDPDFDAKVAAPVGQEFGLKFK